MPTQPLDLTMAMWHARLAGNGYNVADVADVLSLALREIVRLRMHAGEPVPEAVAEWSGWDGPDERPIDRAGAPAIDADGNATICHACKVLQHHGTDAHGVEHLVVQPCAEHRDPRPSAPEAVRKAAALALEDAAPIEGWCDPETGAAHAEVAARMRALAERLHAWADRGCRGDP